MIKTNVIEKPLTPAGTQKAGVMDEKSKAKLEKAVREFQSLFVGYMLKSMRSNVMKTEEAGQGFGGDIMESMFDSEMAKHISKNSNLGLGEMMYKQMTGEELPKASNKVQQSLPVHINTKPVKQSVETQRVVSDTTTQKTKTVAPTAPVVVPKVEKKDSVVSMPRILENSRSIQKTGRADTLSQRLDNFSSFIQEAADTHNVDPNLLKAVIASESSARIDAKSNKSAKGLMQLIDSTASDMGVKNVWDPRQNILGGAKYLKQLLNRFDGDVKLAVASYNAGPGAVKKHNGIPPFKETRNYVSRVLNYLQEFQKEGSAE